MRGKIFFLSAATIGILIAALSFRTYLLPKPAPDPAGPGPWSAYRAEAYGFGFRYPTASVLTPLPSSEQTPFGIRISLSGRYPDAYSDFLVTQRDAFASHFENLGRTCPGLPRSSQRIGERSVILIDASYCPDYSPQLYAVIELDAGRDLVYRANLRDPWMIEQDYAYGILETLNLFVP